MIKLIHLGEVHSIIVYLAVNKVITNKTQNIFSLKINYFMHRSGKSTAADPMEFLQK